MKLLHLPGIWRPAALGMLFGLMSTASGLSQDVWRRHTIDNSSRGADGVRLADVNNDGRVDLTTGWEEGGVVRAYLNPGPRKSRGEWPAVTVGKVRSPEDAVFVDLDQDGAVDVVSCCEGRVKTMFIHWAPTKAEEYLQANAWRTQAIPCTEKQQAWMFAVPRQLDGRHGPDLVVGSKGKNAAIGLLIGPPDARDLAAYRYQRLCAAGWIMSLVLHDMNGDGRMDVVATDRKGANRGIWWIENPGPQAVRQGEAWKKHLIGGKDMEVMFLDVADVDGDGRAEVVTATRNGRILIHRRAQTSADWKERSIVNPLGAPHGKAVRVADLDLDGRMDLVHSVNNGGKRNHHGVTWAAPPKKDQANQPWQVRSISGPEGVKFDLLQLLDLDADGDLDVISCEERDNLGVFWYENPARSSP